MHLLTCERREMRVEGSTVVATVTTSMANAASSAQMAGGDWIVSDLRGHYVAVSEFTALASEEALGRIWNDPAEDLAWSDL